MPRSHVLADRRRINLAEVADGAFARLGATSPLQQHIALHARHVGQHVRYQVRVASFEAVCSMVERGIGLGIVTMSAAQQCARTMQIRRACLDEPWAARILLACTRAGQPLPLQAQRLLDEITQSLPVELRNRRSLSGRSKSSNCG